jgi:hypothetical protein
MSGVSFTFKLVLFMIRYAWIMAIPTILDLGRQIHMAILRWRDDYRAHQALQF